LEKLTLIAKDKNMLPKRHGSTVVSATLNKMTAIIAIPPLNPRLPLIMKPIVAAFDFDKTLTDRDTLIPFLIHSQGAVSTYGHAALLLPQVLLYTVGKISRQELKESFLAGCLKGKPLTALSHHGELFALKINRIIKPEALSRLLWHRQQGHRLVLVTAAIDLYIAPWAELVALFDDVISSKVEIDSKGHLTGKLEGLNCRGAEKVRCLKQLLGPRSAYELYAYGDSEGDRELLAYADHPFYRTFTSPTAECP
jgi:HAD superfamily hydrolase (TIGR01490 family)